jgi:hypothetical protein
LGELNVGPGTVKACGILVRAQKALGFAGLTAPKEVIQRAKKAERSHEDVAPFPSWMAGEAWKKGERDTKSLAFIAALGTRLMLRPGEFEKIRVGHVRLAEGGTEVKIVNRKMDKKNRREPWHFLSCVRKGFCVACWLGMVARARWQSSGLGACVVVDGSGRALAAADVGRVLSEVYRRATGEVGPRFVGKSARVGGAIAAARMGIPTLVIRVTGDWKSDALLRYIGGIIAAKSGLDRALQQRPGDIMGGREGAGWREGEDHGDDAEDVGRGWRWGR